MASITSIITAGALGVWISNDHDQLKETNGILRSNEKEVVAIINEIKGKVSVYQEQGLIKDGGRTTLA